MHLGNHQPVILASQIYNKGFRPKAGAKPVAMWTNEYCVKIADYYWEKDLEPASADEIAEHQQADRERRNRMARKRYQRKMAEKRIEEAERKRKEEAYANGDLPLKTSWQWLDQDHRIPKDDAIAIGRTYRDYDYEEDWYDDDSCKYRTWYYYRKKDTVPVTEDKYQKLQALFIEKFGGWYGIDVKHTNYTGKKWW